MASTKEAWNMEGGQLSPVPTMPTIASLGDGLPLPGSIDAPVDVTAYGLPCSSYDDIDIDEGGPFAVFKLPLFEPRAAERQALERETIASLKYMQERLATRCRGLPLLCAAAVAVGLAAAHTVAGSGEERDSMLAFAIVTEVVVAVLLIITLLASLWSRISRRATWCLRTLLVWCLCTLISLSSPARRGALFAGEGVQFPLHDEPCEEGATTQWIALLLGVPAVFNLLPFAVFAPMSQIICLQHLIIGLCFRRRECAFEDQPLSGPLFGWSPIVVSSLQLHLLVVQFAVVSWRLAADTVFLQVSSKLVQQTQENQRNTRAKTGKDHDFIIRTGLECVMEQIANEELLCLSLVKELIRTAPASSASCAWAETVHVLVDFITFVSARVQNHSTALRAMGNRMCHSLPMRDSNTSSPGEQRAGIRGFIEQSFMAEQVVDDASEDGSLYVNPSSTRGKQGSIVTLSTTWTSREDEASLLVLQQLQNLVDCNGELPLGEWSLNALQADEAMGGGLVRVLGFKMLSRFHSIKAEPLAAFLQLLENGYIKENPYHTQVHAADVTNAMFFLVNSIGLWTSSHLSDTKRISILLAALGHDVGHFGRNSHFLIATKHHLATTYNDRSTLENFHTATLFSMIDKDRGHYGVNLLSDLSSENYSKARQLIVTFILATDTQFHLEALAEFRLRLASMETAAAVEAAKESASQSTRTAEFDPLHSCKDQVELLAFLFRAADIGHSAKRWDIHEAWSGRVAAEFHSQGDEEKSLGVPVSPLCDRTGFVMCKSQVGFLQFVCMPTWNAIVRFEQLFMAALLAERLAKLSPGDPPALDDPKAKKRRSSARSSIFRSSVNSISDGPVRSASSGNGGLSRILAKRCLSQCEANLNEWKKQVDVLKAQELKEAAAG